NRSRSLRIVWLLEELNIPYEIKNYIRGADGLAPKELLDVHPLGKSPVISDGDRVIAESGVIVDYLIKKYGNGKFLPTEENYLDNEYWNHFSEGTLMSAVVMKVIFTKIPAQVPFFIRPLANMICSGFDAGYVKPNVDRSVAFSEDTLKKRGDGWIAGGDKDGNPTAADFMMVFPLQAGVGLGVVPEDSAIKAYIARATGRDAYKRAVERGGV
ncbi:hypothetical protein BDK51DRAFT_22823, partial [Blyttiomyces helicus]